MREQWTMDQPFWHTAIYTRPSNSYLSQTNQIPICHKQIHVWQIVRMWQIQICQIRIWQIRIWQMPSNSYLSQTNTCLTNSTNLTNTNLTNTNLNEVYKKDRIHQSWSSVHSVLVHQTRSIRQLCTLLFWVSGNHFGLVIVFIQLD